MTENVRLGHVVSLFELWNDHPLGLVFGFGLGSEFYSSGSGKIGSNIEPDHLNVIRKYGLIWAMMFFLWVLGVSRSAINGNAVQVRALGWSLFFAFVVCGSNPVLISPLFFLCVFYDCVSYSA